MTRGPEWIATPLLQWTFTINTSPASAAASPRVPLTSNAVERSLRGPVLGRNNHFGSRSKRGTEVAAIFYSLIESARLNGLDPGRYLEQAALASIRGETIPLPHEIR